MQDIKTLEVFAYHRLLVRRYDEALSIYTFLAQLEPTKIKWKLAQSLCLIHQHAYADAKQIANSIAPSALAQSERQFLTKLYQYFTHDKSNANEEEIPA